MKWLEALERVVVIVAACLAVLPLYQFWSEREDRSIDRASNFIVAFVNCAEVLHTEETLRSELRDLFPLSQNLRNLQIQEFRDRSGTASLSELFDGEHENSEAVVELERIIAEAIMANERYREFVSQGITKECQYIQTVNQAR